MKVETDIIASISASLTGRAVIQAFDVTLTDHFQYRSQFLHMRVTNRPNIFVDQGQISDPDFISDTHQRKIVQYADN